MVSILPELGCEHHCWVQFSSCSDVKFQFCECMTYGTSSLMKACVQFPDLKYLKYFKSGFQKNGCRLPYLRMMPKKY